MEAFAVSHCLVTECVATVLDANGPTAATTAWVSKWVSLQSNMFVVDVASVFPAHQPDPALHTRCSSCQLPHRGTPCPAAACSAPRPCGKTKQNNKTRWNWLSYCHYFLFIEFWPKTISNKSYWKCSILKQNINKTLVNSIHIIKYVLTHHCHQAAQTSTKSSYSVTMKDWLTPDCCRPPGTQAWHCELGEGNRHQVKHFHKVISHLV